MIRKLLAKGETQKALESLRTLLFDYADEFRDEFTLLNGRYERYTKERGIRSDSENELSLNKLNNDLLGFRNRMENELKEFISIENLVISAESFDEQLRKKLMGRYRIEEKLGEGGTSIIYRATEISTDRSVAVRALKTHDFAQKYSADTKRQAANSSQKVQEIKHRHIVKIQETYLVEFPVCFVEDFVDGPNLKVLRKMTPWPLSESIRIVTRIGDALYYLHTKGIVHKKVQTKKIFIDREGMPVITTPAIPPFDMFRTSVGKDSLKSFQKDLQYLSPEELSGERVGSKSDQFALALLTFELLTGRPLFNAKSIQGVFDLRHQFFKSKTYRREVFKEAGIPAELARTIRQMLRRDPAERFSSVKEAIEEMIPFTREKTPDFFTARLSYERCCSGNPRFTHDFYAHLFEQTPAILKDFFPNESDRRRNRRRNNMLRSAIFLLLADPTDRNYLNVIKAMPQHKGIAPEHYKQFISSLIETVKSNDYLWLRDPGISAAWEKVNAQAQLRFGWE